MEKLLELDRDLFLFLNGLHSPFMDPILFFLTDGRAWLPLYLLTAYLVYKSYKKESLWILGGIILSIVITDQITTSFMKPFFARLRPSHEPSLQGMVHHVNNYFGGLYGFASSHAANTFGVTMFLWSILRRHYRWSALLFIWPAVMSYSRIYLGVHYPGDIIVGTLIGLLTGWLVFRLYGRLRKRSETSPESVQ